MLPQDSSPQTPVENQPISPSAAGPAQPPGIVVGSGSSAPDTNVPSGKPRSKKKLLLVILAGLLTLVVVAIVAMLFYVIPNRNAQRFTEESTSILSELASEMTNLHDDNFVKAKEITTSYDQAKEVLTKHIKDLDSTRQHIAGLKGRYEALHPAKKNAAEKEKLDKAFTLAGGIQHKYEASLKLRQATFDAYNDLPNELNEYAQAAAKGGLRVDFVRQTNTISNLANRALNEMRKLEPESDDKALYDLRIEYLTLNARTFHALNQYYNSSASPEKISKALAAFSEQNVALNAAITAQIDTYVTRSSIAKDFEAFDKLAGH